SLIVLCGLLFCVELSYRAWLYFRKCEAVCYNISFLTKLDAFNRDNIYKLVADSTVGYLPADGIFAWNGAKITIHKGVRVNPNFEPSSVDDPILVVGGSFVFGDKTSDNETWPAILERRLNRRVVNGGVSGYGPMQAVMHAEQLLKTRTYFLLILSLVVPDIG